MIAKLVVGSALAYDPRLAGSMAAGRWGVSRAAVRLIDASNPGDLEQKVLAKIAKMRASGATDDEILDSVEMLSMETPKANESSPPAMEQPSQSDDQPPRPRPPLDEQAPPPMAPQQGTETWGTWSRAGDSVYIEVFIDDAVRTNEVRVEFMEGWLLAGVDNDSDDAPPPFLFGRFAQPVEEQDLNWAIDDAPDGKKRVLCIELPKKESPTAGVSIDCIFDESLHVNGEPCVGCPGLSSGTITIQMPEQAMEQVAE